MRKKKKQNSVLYLRLDASFIERIAAIASKTGKSRNELALVALQEFVDAMELAAQIEQEQAVPAFEDVLGHRWLSRFVHSGLAGPAMSLAWSWFMEDQRRLRAEAEEDRKERAARLSNGDKEKGDVQ